MTSFPPERTVIVTGASPGSLGFATARALADWGANVVVTTRNDPAETLLKLAEPKHARILTPKLGQVFEPTQLDGATPWWRAV